MDLEKHYETLDKLVRLKAESESLALEIYTRVRNDELYEKLGFLVFRLSKKSYRVHRDYMTAILERLKNGETPESIIADLEKSVAESNNVDMVGVMKGIDNMTNLKRIREAAGISQSKLAEESGVNIRMIQHYEQGVKDLNHAQAITVHRLAQALECKVEDLLETE